MAIRCDVNIDKLCLAVRTWHSSCRFSQSATCAVEKTSVYNKTGLAHSHFTYVLIGQKQKQVPYENFQFLHIDLTTSDIKLVVFIIFVYFRAYWVPRLFCKMMLLFTNRDL